MSIDSKKRIGMLLKSKGVQQTWSSNVPAAALLVQGLLQVEDPEQILRSVQETALEPKPVPVPRYQAAPRPSLKRAFEDADDAAAAAAAAAPKMSRSQRSRTLNAERDALRRSVPSEIQAIPRLREAWLDADVLSHEDREAIRAAFAAGDFDTPRRIFETVTGSADDLDELETAATLAEWYSKK